MLSQEQIDEYKRDGIIVIENILTDAEVEQARTGLHNQLLEHDIDHYGILTGNQVMDEGPRLKSVSSRFFYNKWKMDVCLHENVYNAMKHLMNETYSSGKTSGFEHTLGPSNDVLAYIDRVCWRLPDYIRSEGGLNLHLDRNTVDPYLLKSGGLKKWKPIQAFVTLTDHYGSESGGLKVVKGFHREIDSYFAKNTVPEMEGGGEFYRMDSPAHTLLSKRVQPINAPKGSLVCWDNKLPHATCHKLDGFDTREVVYVGFMPDIEINKTYCQKQLYNIKANIPPPMYLDGRNLADRNWTDNDLSKSQLRMLGI